jgi:hypothetical protein
MAPSSSCVPSDSAPSFEHGTDLYLMGYVIHEHTSFASLEHLERLLADTWFDDEDREKSKQDKTPI